MQNSYSFLVDLCKPGYSAKFKTGDGTLWEIQEHWSFLDNPNSDLVENLGHIIIIRQRNNRSRAYQKEFEAYPLEQTEYAMIKKVISDSSNWISITYRDYDEHFRPRGRGSFERILCKLTFTLIADASNAEGADSEEVRLRKNSFKKRYDYLSLQNIPSTDVKCISIKTVVDFLLDAMRTENTAGRDEAIDFIMKNYTEVKNTESWREFSANYPDMKDEILDRIIEGLCNQSDRASMVLQKTVSQWSLTNDS